MRAHSDVLHASHWRAAAYDVDPALYVEIVRTGSRSRAAGFTFRLYGERPRRGATRKRNTSTHGADYLYAATWDEHGDLFARLFNMDPDAIIGPYDGREEFHATTEGRYR